LGSAILIPPPTTTSSPPPSLARSFPLTQWGVAERANAPGDLTRSIRVHRIVDGDTLESIAQRYLGNPERAHEIFEANRRILTYPDALPIGVEIQIP
jgi:nucleoid-associated protein YgaU